MDFVLFLKNLARGSIVKGKGRNVLDIQLVSKGTLKVLVRNLIYVKVEPKRFDKKFN